jgi:hypothetical protein
MPAIIFAALFIPLALAGIFKHEKMTERWLVKTVCDCDTNTLECKQALHSSIEEQDALRRPNITAATSRCKNERTLYEFNAYLLGVKQETDGDYHLVLRSPYSEATLIAEIPNAAGPEARDSPFAPRFIMARTAVDSLLGFEPQARIHWLTKPTHIHVEGIGFFDEKHMIPQEGAAPNARELHPIIKLEVLK